MSDSRRGAVRNVLDLDVMDRRGDLWIEVSKDEKDSTDDIR